MGLTGFDWTLKIREASRLLTFIGQKSLIAKLLAFAKNFVNSLFPAPAYATA